MPLYDFVAKSLDGRVVKGEMDGDSDAEIRIKLRAKQLVPVKLEPKGAESRRRPAAARGVRGRVKLKDLQVFTRQFAVLIGAGVPIMQSLEALVKGSANPILRKGLNGVAQEVSKGKHLAEAMSRFPMIFDRLYINLVRAGEEAGALDTVLDRLAVYIEKSVGLRGKVMGAMWYPAVIIVVAAGVIAAIMIKVIPKFMEMFKSSGKELPMLTQMVVNASHFMSENWYLILLGIAALIFGFFQFRQTKLGTELTDRAFIRIPLFGELLLKAGIARLSRTLSTLLASGVGILEALEIGARVSGNWELEHAIRRSKDSIAKGKGIAGPLSQEPIIPGMVVTMISIGEQTGALDTMLGKIADFYEGEVDNAVSALTSIIEPLLMVFLGGIIAVIVIAMYLPIFDMAGNVG